MNEPTATLATAQRLPRPPAAPRCRLHRRVIGCHGEFPIGLTPFSVPKPGATCPGFREVSPPESHTSVGHVSGSAIRSPCAPPRRLEDGVVETVADQSHRRDERRPLGRTGEGPRSELRLAGRLDEPFRHDQASPITSGSVRSVNCSASGPRSAELTVTAGRLSLSSARRRFSFREIPSRRARSSIAATTSSGTPRIDTSATRHLRDGSGYCEAPACGSGQPKTLVTARRSTADRLFLPIVPGRHRVELRSTELTRLFGSERGVGVR
jgi:hypothetical protein